MVGLSYCLDEIKCCCWRTEYQKMGRKFKDVLRNLVKQLRKGLKSILDRVRICKHEVYKVNFELFL